MTTRPKGSLIIIGGHEERLDGEREILSEVARRAKRRKGPLLLVTVATRQPDELAGTYRDAFAGLGLRRVRHMGLESRDDAHDPACVRQVAEAGVLFFTGGDQLRITSQIGDSPVYRCMLERYQGGLTIAGTSAGAAAMPETMIVSGPGDETTEISALGMAPGLGLIRNVVVDSHFAERGRMGRLLGAVAQNPKNLGLGIDENTAVMAEDGRFTVLGSGGVYVVDGAGVGYSSLSDRRPAGVLTIHDLRLHVLAAGAVFDLTTRRPVPPECQQ